MGAYVPNLISALRLMAAPLTFWLIVTEHPLAGLAVFLIASLSDAIDGFVARTFGSTSSFGAWLDPAADKLLMIFSLTGLFIIHAIPGWLLGLVVARDVSIAAGWFLVKFFSLPIRLEPLIIGKASTIVQMLYSLASLVFVAFDLALPRLAQALAWTCGVFTILSGAAYAAMFLKGVFAGRHSVP